VPFNPLPFGFLRASERVPNRLALDVGTETLTYADLRTRAASLAATLQARTTQGAPRMTAVFAEPSAIASAGILASLMAGQTYVPLNPRFPPARTKWMLEQAGCRSVIVDAAAEPLLESVLDDCQDLLIVAPARTDVQSLAARCPRHVVVGSEDLNDASEWRPVTPQPDDLAYLLFTSGTTGNPKGVMVTHANVVHFVRTMADRYHITEQDRIAQVFDTTFDLSVFGMFVAWERGASVCCPTRKALLSPDRFLREKSITVWLSVPSIAAFMDRFGLLTEGRYPSLRWSLFCGEALPTRLATRWSIAAPRSTVENLYGPTELTVACAAYRWSHDRSPSESCDGIVPIGWPLPGMKARVVDETLADVPPGTMGELLMTGAQLTPGYWNSRAATDRAYVRMPNDTVFYRTGDRVRQPIGDTPLTFHGRLDQQVKVHGYRVELGEIESALLQAPQIRSAAAVGWPRTDAGFGGIVAFVTGTAVDVAAVRVHLESLLPAYALPRTIRVLTELPYTTNGKVDRTMLVGLLDA
jgi:amino acid adenylation domain-containing protein